MPGRDAVDVDVQQVLAAVRNVVGHPKEPVLLHGPVFEGNELRYVADCIGTGWVSSAGEAVEQFEDQLARLTGAAQAVAVVSGTAALHVAYLLAGVEAGTEILMPSLTFVATANACSYCNATPHFCDVERRTLGLDPAKLDDHLKNVATLRGGGCFNRQTGRRIAALVPVHAMGHPADLPALLEVAARWHVPVVEDAAEAVGSYQNGRHVGTSGRLGVLSFNGNKTVTTGGGGAILTDDVALAERARHLTTTARVAGTWEYVHDEIGFNYRMPNINAALGCAQLECLPELLRRKRTVAERYIEAFGDVRGVRLLIEPDGCRSNYWLNTLLLDRADVALRDEILRALNEAQLPSRAVWRPMHLLDIYRNCPRADLTVTEEVSRQAVNVPSGPGLVKARP